MRKKTTRKTKHARKKETKNRNRKVNSPKEERKISIAKVLSGFLLMLSVFQGTKYLKNNFWDEPPVSNYSYSNIETISELERLNTLYDNTGDSAHIDRIVEIIAHNFHNLRHSNPENFNSTFNQIQFLNSANITHTNSKMSYLGLINSKIISRNDWHDIEFIARIKDEAIENNFKSNFNVWWEKQIILNDYKGNEFTRRSIILNYAFHRLNKRFSNTSNDEIIKKFEFSGVLSNYNPENGILMIDAVVFRQSKSTRGSIIRNEDVLLFENIRGISGEITETLKASFITNS